MIVSIHQPQYLPWLGYIHKMDQADAFVFLDTVHFKKNEWQNRNRIKTASGPQWLTVPVIHSFGQAIEEVRINDTVRWQKKQSQALVTNYGKAGYFEEISGLLSSIWEREWVGLSELNVFAARTIAGYLGVNTELFLASEMGELPDHPDERLIGIVKLLGTTTYIAGAGGRSYMEMERYEKRGVEVVFQEFNHPVYPQLFGDFVPNLSVVDLLFNCGPESLRIIRGET